MKAAKEVQIIYILKLILTSELYFKNLKALVTILWNIKDEEFGFAYAIYRDDWDSALKKKKSAEGVKKIFLFR